MKHVNLFDHASDAKEVYAALQRDFARDSRILYWNTFALFVTFGIGCYFWPAQGWIWLVIASAIAVNGLNMFVDNSNRNWTLHLIDWIVATDANRAGDKQETM